MKTILTIFGTRPEAIKMAPVVKNLEQSGDFRVLTAVTAQHRQMLDQVLDLFAIRPEYDLDIMQKNQTLSDITLRGLLGLKPVLEQEKPDLVLVHGDTTTTLVGSLAAYYQKIPVGHVEAGLRTYDKYAPYPEEMNRRLIGAIADIHFAPTATTKANLCKEGVSPGSVVVTGNTVIDALMKTLERAYHFQNDLLNRVDFNNHKVILVTAHRRENLGDPMRHVFKALKEVITVNLDAEAVFPVHRNPKIRELAQEILGTQERVHLLEPLDYQPFVHLMQHSHLVLTDSGGIQEEAPTLGKPVLVLRDITERPEALAAGTVKLVGTDPEKIINETNLLLREPQAYRKMAGAVNPYGDGRASQRICQALRLYFGLSIQPVEELG